MTKFILPEKWEEPPIWSAMDRLQKYADRFYQSQVRDLEAMATHWIEQGYKPEELTILANRHSICRSICPKRLVGW